MSNALPSIAVIGAGLTGTLLSIELLRRVDARQRFHLFLFEKAPPFGRGVAYGTENPSHLLNVRAGEMSAYEDRPADFVTWLNSSASGDIGPLQRPVPPDAFVPRNLFGRYLQHALQGAVERAPWGHHFRPVGDEVIDIVPGPADLAVRTRDGRQVPVERAVLCLGNLPPDRSELLGYIGDPWNGSATRDLDPAADVLIIGTGMTMVDTVLSLVERGHFGKIHAVSRRGLLPRVHSLERPTSGWRVEVKLPASTLGLLRAIRAEVARAGQRGQPWQDVFAALRPQTQGLWQRLSYGERQRFLRHLQPWWDVHRHRLPPQVAHQIAALQQTGQLQVSAATIAALHPRDDGIEAHLRPRAASAREVLYVDRVINCSGANTNYESCDLDVVRSLLARGDARCDVHRLGLDVDQRGALVDRYGRTSGRLFALGPVTRGTLWEITAVPEIRRQCISLAERLTAPHFPQPTSTSKGGELRAVSSPEVRWHANG